MAQTGPRSRGAGWSGAKRGHRLELDDIGHRFGEVEAVRDIALDIEGGEFVALLGPSGCGKTTLLRIVAGFIAQSRGRVLFEGKPVDHLPANRRGVGIVFQSYALFPHMTAAENVAYGLEARRVPRAEVRERVGAMLRLVHMEGMEARFPRELSGGQQQRVALARALATDPGILLLDEPFGALDKNLRLDMQIEVKRLQRECGVTAIMVTHDQEEALSLADRIAVMNRGRIEQCANPGDIYDRPGTLFVNRFVGHANLLAGTAEAGPAVRLADGTVLPVSAETALAPGTEVYLSIRPEGLRPAPAGNGAILATVKVGLPLGPRILYECEAAGAVPIKLDLPRQERMLQPGETVHLQPTSPLACRLFPRSNP